MAKVKFNWVGGQADKSKLVNGRNTGEWYAGYKLSDASEIDKFEVGDVVDIKTDSEHYAGKQTVIQLGTDDGKMTHLVTDRVVKSGENASGTINKGSLLLPIGIGIGILGIIAGVVIYRMKN
jgi:hypothetical protein